MRGGSNTPTKVVLRKCTFGTVKWYNVKNGYALINRDDTHEDIFEHKAAMKCKLPQLARPSLGDGEAVGFDVVDGGRRRDVAQMRDLLEPAWCTQALLKESVILLE